MRRYLPLIVVLVLLASAIPLLPASAVVHSGDITTNTVWTAAASPHIINGPIKVRSGVTLTIQQGSTVVIEPGGELIVNGVLNANGNAANMIFFTGNYSSTKGEGLTFPQSYRGGSTIDHCNFTFLKTAIRHESNVWLNVTNSWFEDCDKAMQVQSGSSDVASCRFNMNTNDIYHFGKDLIIFDCRFDLSTDGVVNSNMDGHCHIENTNFFNVQFPITNWNGMTGINMTLTNPVTGIRVYNGDPSDFYNVTIKWATNYGIQDQAWGSYYENVQTQSCNYGFYGSWNENTMFIDCTFFNGAWQGMYFWNSRNVYVENSTISSGLGANCTIRAHATEIRMINTSVSEVDAPTSIYTSSGAWVSLVNVTWSFLDRYLEDIEDMIFEYDLMHVRVVDLSTTVPGALVHVNSTTTDVDTDSGITDATGHFRHAKYLDRIIVKIGQVPGNPTNCSAYIQNGTRADTGHTVSTVTPGSTVTVTVVRDNNMIVWPGDHYVNGANEVYNNVTIIAMGDVQINSSWYLGLHNVTLYMFSVDQEGHTLRVEPGATLIARDSYIKSRGFNPMGEPTFFRIDIDGNWSSPASVYLNHTEILDAASVTIEFANFYAMDCNLSRWGWVYLEQVIFWCNFTYFSENDFWWELVDCFSVFHGCVFIGATTLSINGGNIWMNYCTKINGDKMLEMKQGTLHMDNSYLDNCYTGIEVSWPGPCIIYVNNTNMSNMNYGIEVRSDMNQVHTYNCEFFMLWGAGIYSSMGEGNQYTDMDSEFEGCMRGIELWSDMSVSLQDTRFIENMRGVYMGSRVYFKAHGLFMRSDDVNLFFDSPSEFSVVVENSTLRSPNPAANASVYMYDVWRAYFINCSIGQGAATTGLFLDWRSGAYLRNTTITGSNAISLNDDECYILVQSFFHVKLVNNSGGSTDNGFVSCEDSGNNFTSQGFANPGGYIWWQVFSHWKLTRLTNTSLNYTMLHGVCGSGYNTHFNEQQFWIEPFELITLTLYLNTSIILWPDDHVLTSNESYADVMIIALGNVTIPAPWWLAFDDNVSLMMLPKNDNKGVDIQDGGFFNITFSTISCISVDPDGERGGFYFWVGQTTGGALSMVDSIMSNGYEDGILVRNSVNVLFDNTTFYDVPVGIWLQDSWAQVNDSYFLHCDVAIRMERSLLFYTWSNVSYCDTPLEVYDNSRVESAANEYYESSGQDILVRDGSLVNVSWSYFKGHVTCIDVENAKVNSIYNNFSTTWRGAYIQQGAEWVSFQDTFWENDYGLYSWYWDIDGRPEIVVMNSTFTSSNWNGIYLQHTNLSLSNVHFQSAKYAIYCSESSVIGYDVTMFNTPQRSIEAYHSDLEFHESAIAWNNGDTAIYVDDTKAWMYNCTLVFISSMHEQKLYGNSVMNWVNSSFSNSSIYYDNSFCKVKVYWFAHVQTILSSGTGIQANVTIRDKGLREEARFWTDTQGWYEHVVLLGAVHHQFGTDNNMNPHNFTGIIMGAYYGYEIEPMYNTKIVKITFYDTMKPVTTLTIGHPKYRAAAGDTWNVTWNTTFTFTGTDMFSGVANIFFNIDGGTWATYGTPFTFFWFGQGFHTINYYAVDTVGNAEDMNSYTIFLDRWVPSYELVLSQPNYNVGDGAPTNVTSMTTLSINANDTRVGVKDVFYAIDGGPTFVYTGTFTIGALGLAEGYHYIHINTWDHLFNAHPFAGKFEFVIDDTAPSTTLDVGTPRYRALDTDNWNITWATEIGLNAFDNASGVGAIYVQKDTSPWELASTSSVNFSGFSQGWHSLRYNATDILGNMELTQEVWFYVDVEGPEGSLDIGSPSYRESDTDNWNVTGSTPIGLNSTDRGSGTDQMFYRIDGGTWFTFSAAFNIPGDDGERTIEVYGRDNLGNEGPTSTFKVVKDTTGPVVDIVVGDPSYRDDPADLWNITTTTPISFSGGQRFEYKLNDGEFTDVTGDITIDTGGKQKLYFAGFDHLDNRGPTLLVELLVDDKGPAVSMSVGSPSYRELETDEYNITHDTPISLSATDMMSGVSSIHYRIDGGSNKVYSSAFTLKDESEGRHVVEVWGVDNLGTSSPVTGFGLAITTSKPSVWLAANEPKYDSGEKLYITSTTLLSIGSNSLSGFKSLTYQIDDEPVIEYTGAFTLDGRDHGDHTLKLIGTDNFDQVTPEVNVMVYIDDEAPTMSAKVDGAGGPDSFMGGVLIEMDAEDVGSGLGALEYAMDSGAWTEYTDTLIISEEGYHTFEYRAIDNVGNIKGPFARSFTITGGTSGGFFSIQMIPPPPERTNMSELEVTGVCTPGYTIVVFLNGEEAADVQSPTSTFRMTISLAEGDNSISCSIRKGAVLVANTSAYDVELDSIAPILTVAAPYEGQEVEADIGELKFTFDENIEDYEVEVAGKNGDVTTSVTATGELLTVGVGTLEPGAYTAKVTVGDDLGNERLYTIGFTVKAEAAEEGDGGATTTNYALIGLIGILAVILILVVVGIVIMTRKGDAPPDSGLPPAEEPEDDGLEVLEAEIEEDPEIDFPRRKKKRGPKPAPKKDIQYEEPEVLEPEVVEPEVLAPEIEDPEIPEEIQSGTKEVQPLPQEPEQLEELEEIPVLQPMEE